MYSAIADQLYLLGKTKDHSYHSTRHAASTYLRENPDSFMPFVPSIMGEDMAGAVDQGGSEQVYAEYCKRVEQSGDWGGEIEVSHAAHRKVVRQTYRNWVEITRMR